MLSAMKGRRPPSSLVTRSMGTLLLLGSLAFVGGADTRQVPTQEDLNAFMARVGGLDLGESAYVAAGKVFEDGHCRWSFDSGVFVPIHAGTEDRRVVGVVFVGEGTMEVRFPQRGEAWNFANHMVVRGEKSPESMAPVAHQEAPYRVAINQGLILSADDKVVRLLTGLEPLGAGTVYSETEDGQYDLELMVTDRRGRVRAVAQAYDLMAPRMTLLRKAGWDGELMINRDRLLHEGLGVPPEELGLVGDFMTRDRFMVALETNSPVGARADDQWLTCLRDGSGSWELGRSQTVASHGIDPRDVYTRDEFGGMELNEQPLPVRSIHADTTLQVAPSADRITLEAQIDQRLSFYAEREVRHLSLRLPRDESLDGDFEVLGIKTPEGLEIARVEFLREGPDLPDWIFDKGLADGTNEPTNSSGPPSVAPQDTTELDVSGKPKNVGPRDLGHQTGSLEVVLALPQPVPAGEYFEIDLSWRSRWPYDVTYLFTDLSGSASAGTSSGFRTVVPRVIPSTARAAWSYEIEAAVPRGRRMPQVAVSGDTIKTWSEDGRDWTRASGVGALRPGVAVGAWRTTEQGGQPTIKLHVFKGDLWAIEEYPPEVRRALDFMETLVGPLPMGEIEVYQGPLATVAGGRLPGHGLLEVLQPWTTPTKEQIEKNPRREPRNQQITAARQLAMQYFANLIVPTGQRNRWLGGAIPDAYGSFYIRDVFGDDWYWKGVDGLRYLLEDPEARESHLSVPRYQRFNKSMTLYSTRQAIFDEAWRLAGLYLITGMLPRETGWPGLLTGLRELQQTHISRDVSTEDLKQALEQASGEDLSDFWDFWVVGSLVPSLSTTWTRDDDGDLTLCVISDLPFGRFEVPVAVADRSTERVEEVVITVEDGVGVEHLTGVGDKVRVALDPGGFLLTLKRKVRKVKELPPACVEAPAPESPPEP